MTNKKGRDKILEEAAELINGTRAKDYGDAYENHDRKSKMWSVVLEKEVTVEQVYMCMIAVKLSRLMQTPYHQDSAIDICGYGALLGEAGNGKG